jgi:hypothetical protein
MNDKDLLELAARAAGAVWVDQTFPYGEFGRMMLDFGGGVSEWNPLESDGDALRLAVNLGISLLPYPVYAESDRHSVMAKQRRRTDTMRVQNPTEVIELYGDDPYAATRRAIVCAAAAMGKDMK